MTEASVSFAGNLTDDPEVRYTEGGIARAMFRVAVSGRREQEASFFTVIAWRDQADHAAQSLSRAAGSGSWPAPAAELDRRGRQRPGECRGRGRGAGAQPAVGDRDDDQGDAQLRAVANTTGSPSSCRLRLDQLLRLCARPGHRSSSARIRLATMAARITTTASARTRRAVRVDGGRADRPGRSQPGNRVPSICQTARQSGKALQPRNGVRVGFRR
jgi:hypothetical protein